MFPHHCSDLLFTFLLVYCLPQPFFDQLFTKRLLLGRRNCTINVLSGQTKIHIKKYNLAFISSEKLEMVKNTPFGSQTFRSPKIRSTKKQFLETKWLESKEKVANQRPPARVLTCSSLLLRLVVPSLAKEAFIAKFEVFFEIAFCEDLLQMDSHRCPPLLVPGTA